MPDTTLHFSRNAATSTQVKLAVASAMPAPSSGRKVR